MDAQLINDFSAVLDEVKRQLLGKEADDTTAIVSALEKSLANWTDLDKDVQANKYAFRKMVVCDHFWGQRDECSIGAVCTS